MKTNLMPSVGKLRRVTKGVSKTGMLPNRTMRKAAGNKMQAVRAKGGPASTGQKATAMGVNAVASGRKNVNKLGNKAINVGKKLGMSDATTKNLRKHSGKIGAGIVAGGALGVAGAVSARNKAKEDKKFKNRAKKFIGMR